MRLSLCEAATRETRPDHNTGNYVPYSAVQSFFQKNDLRPEHSRNQSLRFFWSLGQRTKFHVAPETRMQPQRSITNAVL